MGKHNKYIEDSVITGEEFLFGSDSPSLNKPSRNYQLNKILEWIITRLSVSVVDSHYEHEQLVPATTWNIPHYLGKKPSYQVFASDGERILITLEHLDENNARINFNEATTGSVTLN